MFNKQFFSALFLLAYHTQFLEAIQNFEGTFTAPPKPFQLRVDQEFIAATKHKASLTRVADDLEDNDWKDGPPKHNISAIRDYWADKYDWEKIESTINGKFKQFTTVVHAGKNYTHPIPLHFVHHRSSRSDATPLLFIHGWPGSFLEVGKIIDALTSPQNSSLPAFHVVAPSLPGFGFSPAPVHAGLGLREAGQGFNNLMQQLGYKKYYIQGGDFGGFTLRHMAADFPETVVSVLSNFWLTPPTAADMIRYENGNVTDEERKQIELLTAFNQNFAGYRDIQQTRPLQLAVALTDSPVGFVAWIYDFMYNHVDHYWWTVEEIITWGMMYYIQGPYSGLRMYKEAVREGDWQNNFPYISQPVGVSTFPEDGFKTPLNWIRQDGNLTWTHDNTKGGHFAAYEVPELLVHDIQEFFAKYPINA